MAGIDRITRSVMLMEIAFTVAKRGTCSRAQVGCVIARDGRIISMGYNGAPSGIPHCNHFVGLEAPMIMVEGPWNGLDAQMGEQVFKMEPGRVIETPKGASIISLDPGCTIAEHAERNAIAFAARYGTALDGAELYCTHAPCLNCARMIINSGIKCVRFTIPYRITDGVELLQQAKIDVIEMSVHK